MNTAKRIRSLRSPAVAAEIVGDFAIVVHKDQPLTDEEWEQNVLLQTSIPPERCRLIVWTEGAAPTAKQRAVLKAALAGGQPLTAVLTNSLLSRSIGVAIFRFFNPRVRIFPTEKIEQAFDYLGAPSANRRVLLETIMRLRAELDSFDGARLPETADPERRRVSGMRRRVNVAFTLGPIQSDSVARSFTDTSLPRVGAAARAEQNERGWRTGSRMVGCRLAERYRIVRTIGSGGMGIVFEVEDSDGSPAAAKLVYRRHVGDQELAVRRFLREASTAISIESMNVTRTREVRRDPSLAAPFIVMDLLNGIDLKTLLLARGALEAAPAVRVLVQAARGIAAAHSKGIIHRDIKPANLFLHIEDRGAHATIKVCDFGIAKRATTGDAPSTHDLTDSGGILGSPLYMSPEQALNSRTIDHRSDIYSLCASLYETLSGRKLWPDSLSLGELIVSICTKHAPPLRSIAPWVHPDLARIVHRGLSVNADERWSSIEELIAALTPHTGDSDIVRLADLRSDPSFIHAPPQPKRFADPDESSTLASDYGSKPI